MKKSLLASIFFMSAMIAPMQTRAVAATPAMDADITPGAPTDSNEKQSEEPLEKRKKEQSDWKINVWPQERRDNVMSPHERKEENKFRPPDRF